MAPDHLRAALYYIQDPTSYKYLAVTRGQLEMSAETYIWEIRDTSDFTYQYIRVRDSEQYLRDNGHSYELVNTMDANSEWQGLSKSYGFSLVIVLCAGFLILISGSCVLDPAMSSTGRPSII